MIRRVIQINEELCNGCGLCVTACHEGAIGLKNGKAVLLRDDYCDGLGDCLPSCPTKAITFIEREALPFDEEAVLKHMAEKAKAENKETPIFAGCPGSMSKALDTSSKEDTPNIALTSELTMWPVQLQLVNPQAQFFNNAELLISADCTPFAYANFHKEFMKNKVTLIGCPKLDNADYLEKIKTIVELNNIKSVSIVRMEVPCCGGLERAVVEGVKASGKDLDVNVTVITIDGNIKN